jgi:hypothetical protein
MRILAVLYLTYFRGHILGRTFERVSRIYMRFNGARIDSPANGLRTDACVCGNRNERPRSMIRSCPPCVKMKFSGLISGKGKRTYLSSLERLVTHLSGRSHFDEVRPLPPPFAANSISLGECSSFSRAPALATVAGIESRVRSPSRSCRFAIYYRTRDCKLGLRTDCAVAVWSSSGFL